MTQNIKEWFIPRFETEVHQAYQQRTTRLGDTVSGGGTFVGDKCYFPRLGVVEAYENVRFAELALANADQDFIEVSAKAKFIAFGLYDPDHNKYSIATAVEYGKAAAAAIARAEDRAIINALNVAGTVGVAPIGGGAPVPVTTIGDYDTPADLDLIVEGITLLGENEAFEGEDITCVTPFRNKVLLSMDPYLAKSDMKGNRPWEDVRWRHTQMLPKPEADGVDIYLYARSAMVSAYNDQMTKIDERLGASLTDMNGYWLQVGAAPRDGRGIIRIKSKATFPITRRATDVNGLVGILPA